MLFTADVTVPKSTAEASPTTQILRLAHGILAWVSVLFPPGCAGLAHCVILHHEHQIVPSTENMNLSGDTHPIEWDDYYECYQPPYEFKIKAWNEDDTYAHTITIRVAIMPRKAIVPLSITDALKAAFGVLSPKRIFTAEG